MGLYYNYLCTLENALKESKNLLKQLYQFKTHKRDCEIENCEFCTCGLQDLQERVVKFVNQKHEEE